MNLPVGQLAALMTSVAWSFSSVFFTLSGRKVGSEVVNRTRLLLAVLLVSIIHLILMGKPFPYDAEGFRFGWLALSGLIGYVVGDGFLFRAFVMIGPRLSMLLMALAPVFSAIFSWVFFHEGLTPIEGVGMGLALTGVALVISDRQPAQPGDTPHDPRHYLMGLLFGLGAALGQASGLVASKIGLADNFSPVSGNLIRLVAAASIIWLIAVVRGQSGETFSQLKGHPRTQLAILGGAIAGPTLGVLFSLIAIQNTDQLGVAATLMSLTPIFLLPVGRIVFKERIGWRAVLGTLVAFSGTLILFG